MALGLSEVLSKQNLAASCKNSQPFDSTSKDLPFGKRLKPWESAETLTINPSQQNSVELQPAQERAERAVQKAKEIVSKNKLMIDEIHRRRQSDRSMGLSIPEEGPRSLEGLKNFQPELSEEDPVLKLWKRSFWERFSDILH